MLLEKEGNPDKQLTAESFTKEAELKTAGDELAMVVGSATEAEAFQTNKQWTLMWRDADLLYQSPRPMSVYENTYILEPNVQRFTVAKVCNAVVPQLYKGLFYDDPPMVLRPRPGVSQEVTDAKTALFAYFLDKCNFKTETKWGLEQMAHLGTGIWKYGVEYKQVEVRKRIAATTIMTSGPEGAQQSEEVVTDDEPKIEIKTKDVPCPFFEYREISRVLVDPHCEVGDIRQARFVIDVRYMDYYDVDELRKGLTDENGKLKEDGWDFPEDLMGIWLPPVNEQTPPILSSEQASKVEGVVHHAEIPQVNAGPDPLRSKLEVLEYWDKRRKIIVINRKHVLFSGENQFKRVPFLSANWWNRRKAFYGMGLGLIVGQNQRVDQGTINAILKILSFGVNPIYLRRRDANSPTQMIRTGLGKILTVDGEVDKAYKLLDVPKVPSEVWNALAESEKATESTSGADQMLVQGSTAGPRTSMGRTSGGASILANASATRLDGPLDNFIEQVFKPFLYVLDEIVFTYVSDAQINTILGDELGKEIRFKWQEFHDARFEFEVLAGASLAAKRTMMQSMMLITQIFENPQIQQSLAEINEEYIDFKPILSMWMEASEWKNKQDIIKPLTPQMKQKMVEKSQAAQAASKMAQQMQLNQQKFEQKQELEDQANQNRMYRDVVREAGRKAMNGVAVEGVPDNNGFGDNI